MSHNKMSAKAIELLAGGLRDNTRLTDFFFTHNNLAEHLEASKTLLATFANKKDLRSLAFNSCNLDNVLLLSMQKAIEDHTKLKELYLFANKIDKEGAQYISKIIQNKNFLTCLGLSNNRLDAAGAVEIAKYGLKDKTSIVKLSIENNGIGNEGLKEISIALAKCTKIEELYLYNNEIDDDPIKDFTALLRN